MNRFLMLFLILAQIVSAQFKWSAKIEPVLKSGTYQIVLPTKMASASKEDFSDLRIFDSKNIEIPYVIENNLKVEKANKIDFKIISRTSLANKKSSIIIENSDIELDFIIAEMANYSGDKTIVVSGSNNSKEWFGVLQPTILRHLNGNDLSVSIKLSFPKTSYKFLKIETIDKNSLPINILAISTTKTENRINNYLKIKTKSIQIKQFLEEKKTRIFVEFPDIELIDKIQFDIPLSLNYKRKVRLIENVAYKVKRKTVYQQQFFADFELTPISNKNQQINQKRTTKFVIEIDNLDNAPLNINTVNFYQQVVIILASLEANEKYAIKTKNFNAYKPAYDISNIDTSNVVNLPFVNVLKATQKQATILSSSEKYFWNSPIFLWICISIATVTVLFFVAGFLKDLKKDES